MKITKVDVLHLKTNLKNGHWRPIVCRIYTDEGIYGDGEAGVAYGTGYTAAYGMIVDMAHHIIGMDPMNTELIWETILKGTFWGQGGGVVVFSGMSALDIALWDIKGKALGVPIYQLLGGKCRNELRCYASQLQFGWTTKIGPWGSDKEYVDIVRHAVSEGYDAVKIDFTTYDENAKKIPHLSKEGFPDRSLYKRIESRMAAIREEFPDIDIIVENHCQTDLTSAIRIGELCDKYDMMAYEEPVTMLNPDMMKELRQRIRGEGIVEYDRCLSSHTVALPDGTYCYCTLDCAQPLGAFLPAAQAEVARVKAAPSLDDGADPDELFFVSSLPWLTFSAISLPTPTPADSNPRITFGKFTQEGDRVLLPVNLTANHALVDGLHLSRFYESLAERLNEKM